MYRCASLNAVTTADNKSFSTVAPHCIVTQCSWQAGCTGLVLGENSTSFFRVNCQGGTRLKLSTKLHGVPNKMTVFLADGIILFACLFLVFLFVLICFSWYAVFTLWNVTRSGFCLLWIREQHHWSGFRYSCCQISTKCNFHSIQINISFQC